MAGWQKVGSRLAAGGPLASPKGWPKAGRRLHEGRAPVFFGAAAKRRETLRNVAKRRKTPQNPANFPGTLCRRAGLVPPSGLQAWRRDPPPKKIVK